MFAITTTPWDPATAPTTDILAQIRNFTGPVLEPWRRAGPGSDTYLSEAAELEPDFLSGFYGAGAGVLWTVAGIEEAFYALGSVGSEEWELERRAAVGFPDQNGWLCKKP